MFTGLIEEIGIVESRESDWLCVTAKKTLEDLCASHSIAVNGACLTVVDMSHKSFTVNLAPETIRRTNLGILQSGDRVNLERSLPANARMGGHIVQGHVDAKGKLISSIREGEATMMRFRAPAQLMPYIVEKGFISVDGISLTIVKKLRSAFTISVIPYTLSATNIGGHQHGDLVNLETDILGKYIESFLSSRR